MLRLSDVSVTLGRKRVLNRIDLDIRPGAVTAILGPNGSGKSTLIRAICAEVAHDGAITLNGAEVSGMAPWRLASLRGVLAQATPVAFSFTVAEVVALGLTAGRDGGDASLIGRALAEVGLSDAAQRPFHDLSGGQQARVHLARVRAQIWDPVTEDGPRWLFLDEPVAALDIAHQLQVMRIMRRFADQGGGVVAVMHDLNLSAMVADRIALMHEGRILATGAPAETLTDANLSAAYGCQLRVGRAPEAGAWVLPQAATLAG